MYIANFKIENASKKIPTIALFVLKEDKFYKTLLGMDTKEIPDKVTSVIENFYQYEFENAELTFCIEELDEGYFFCVADGDLPDEFFQLIPPFLYAHPEFFQTISEKDIDELFQQNSIVKDFYIYQLDKLSDLYHLPPGVGEVLKNNKKYYLKTNRILDDFLTHAEEDININYLDSFIENIEILY